MVHTSGSVLNRDTAGCSSPGILKVWSCEPQGPHRGA